MQSPRIAIRGLFFSPNRETPMAGHDTTKNHTDFISYALAEWATNLTWDSLSPEAIHASKLFLFDSFGCALGGSQQHGSPPEVCR